MDQPSYRLREIIQPASGRSLVVDTSAGQALGALPGLHDFAAAAAIALPRVDGLVCAPGQARRLQGRTRADAALIARADWTNAMRPADFVLPPASVQHLPLITVEDALDLGASALVLTFLLGHAEAIEAACLKRAVHYSLEGAAVGLPVLVDVQPVGPRVRLFEKAVELGVSYALESGAAGVVIPWPGEPSLTTILTMAATTPVWVWLPDGSGNFARRALELGAVGLWAGAGLFAQPDPAAALDGLRALVQPAPQEN
jgi:DhnA family fructose-bisphosphate aldolase class Ia